MENMAAAEPFPNDLQIQPTSEDMKNFMDRVKREIGEEKYQTFLDIIGEYQEKQTSIPKLLKEMSGLLSYEPNLVKELNHLPPIGISMQEIERKQPSSTAPKPKRRWRSGLGYLFVAGLGVTLGIWAHLLF